MITRHGSTHMAWDAFVVLYCEIKYVVAFEGPKYVNIHQSLPRDLNLLTI